MKRMDEALKSARSFDRQSPPDGMVLVPESTIDWFHKRILALTVANERVVSKFNEYQGRVESHLRKVEEMKVADLRRQAGETEENQTPYVTVTEQAAG